MSWGTSCVGKPEAIVRHLDEYGAGLSGQSKVEFDDAKPHLVAVLGQTFRTEESGYAVPMLEFNASGSGAASGGKQVSRDLSVSIKPFYGKLVT